MSTSAAIVFKDPAVEVTLYQHSDGFLKVVKQYLAKAQKYAWKLPRF